MSIPTRRKDVVLRRIHGAYLLVDVADKYQNNSCSIFELNEIGAVIWNHIDGIRSTWDIALLLHEMVEDIVLIDDIERYWLHSRSNELRICRG